MCLEVSGFSGNLILIESSDWSFKNYTTKVENHGGFSLSQFLFYKATFEGWFSFVRLRKSWHVCFQKYNQHAQQDHTWITHSNRSDSNNKAEINQA